MICDLLQIENEYGPQAKALGAEGHQYANWAAEMAVKLDTGVPWVMCKEDDAPDPVVCNHLEYIKLWKMYILIPTFRSLFLKPCLLDVVCRLTHAMVSIVMISPPTNLTNQQYGLRLGLAGM